MKFAKALALIVALALILPAAFAEGRQFKFNLDVDGMVGGKNLRSGTYKVEIKCEADGKGTVTFFDGTRRVVQVPCNMIETKEASDFYGVAYGKDSAGKRVVTTIFLKGATEKVLLPAGN